MDNEKNNINDDYENQLKIKKRRRKKIKKLLKRRRKQ